MIDTSESNSDKLNKYNNIRNSLTTGKLILKILFPSHYPLTNKVLSIDDNSNFRDAISKMNQIFNKLDFKLPKNCGLCLSLSLKSKYGKKLKNFPFFDDDDKLHDYISILTKTEIYMREISDQNLSLKIINNLPNINSFTSTFEIQQNQSLEYYEKALNKKLNKLALHNSSISKLNEDKQKRVFYIPKTSIVNSNSPLIKNLIDNGYFPYLKSDFVVDSIFLGNFTHIEYTVLNRSKDYRFELMGYKNDIIEDNGEIHRINDNTVLKYQVQTSSPPPLPPKKPEHTKFKFQKKMSQPNLPTIPFKLDNSVNPSPNKKMPPKNFLKSRNMKINDMSSRVTANEVMKRQNTIDNFDEEIVISSLGPKGFESYSNNVSDGTSSSQYNTPEENVNVVLTDFLEKTDSENDIVSTEESQKESDSDLVDLEKEFKEICFKNSDSEQGNSFERDNVPKNRNSNARPSYVTKTVPSERQSSPGNLNSHIKKLSPNLSLTHSGKINFIDEDPHKDLSEIQTDPISENPGNNLTERNILKTEKDLFERESKVEKGKLEKALLDNSLDDLNKKIDLSPFVIENLSPLFFVQLIKNSVNCKKNVVKNKKKYCFDIASIERFIKDNFYVVPKNFSVEIVKKMHQSDLISPIESFKLAGSFISGTSQYLPKSQFYIKDEFNIKNIVNANSFEKKILEELFLHKDFLFLRSIISLAKKNNEEDFARYIVQFIYYHKLLTILSLKFVEIRYLKEDEFTLLRASREDTWIWTIMFKDDGMMWLNKVLSPLLISLEEVPTKEKENEFVYDFIRKIISQIQKHLLDIDSTLVVIIQTVCKYTSQKLKNCERLVVASFLILRYICPALLTPQDFGFRTNEKFENFMLTVTKILQVVANQKNYSSKSKDAVHIPFVEEVIPVFQEIFDKFINPETKFQNLLNKPVPSLDYYNKKILPPILDFICKNISELHLSCARVVNESVDDQFVVLTLRSIFLSQLEFANNTNSI